MSETSEAEAPVRAFHRSDYERFRQIVRNVRKEHGDEFADALAARMVAAFITDSPTFETERWLSSTMDVPAYVTSIQNALRTATHEQCSSRTAPESKVNAVLALASELGEVVSEHFPHMSAAGLADSVRPASMRTAAVPGTTPDDDDEDDDDEPYNPYSE